MRSHPACRRVVVFRLFARSIDRSIDHFEPSNKHRPWVKCCTFAIFSKRSKRRDGKTRTRSYLQKNYVHTTAGCCSGLGNHPCLFPTAGTSPNSVVVSQVGSTRRLLPLAAVELVVCPNGDQRPCIATTVCGQALWYDMLQEMILPNLERRSDESLSVCLPLSVSVCLSLSLPRRVRDLPNVKLYRRDL